MKKWKIILLIIAMTFCLGSCHSRDMGDLPAGDNGEIKQIDPIDWEALGLRAGDYVEILSGEEYYLASHDYILGNELITEFAVQGENFDSYISFSGFNGRTLYLDGVRYDYDLDALQYSEKEVDYEQAAELLGEGYDYTRLEYKTTGQGSIPGLEEFNTGEYYYEEYLIDIGTEATPHEVIIRFYFTSDDLYAIYTDDNSYLEVKVIDALTKEIPEDMFVPYLTASDLEEEDADEEDAELGAPSTESPDPLIDDVDEEKDPQITSGNDETNDGPEVYTKVKNIYKK